MEQPTPLRSCDDLDNLYRDIDSNCATKLEENYTLVKFLGSGAYGFVMEIVDHHNNKFAMKVINVTESRQISEVKFGCNLNTLKNETIIFNYIHGWTICKQLPEKWKEIVKTYKKHPWFIDFANAKTKLLIMVLDVNQYTLDNAAISEEDAHYITFILLHGISVARRKFPMFQHRDLHENNIMLNLSFNEDFKLTMQLSDNRSVTLKNIKWIPSIIDFGLSYFETKKPFEPEDEKTFPKSASNANREKLESKNDLFRIKDIITDKLHYRLSDDFQQFFQSDLYKKAINAPATNYKLIEELLQHPFFKSKNYIFESQQKKQKLIKCKVCFNSNVQYKYKTIPNYMFCSINCETKFSVLKQFLPK